VSTSGELCDLPATVLARMLRDREVSAREVLEAHLRRIEAVNPAVNAIVTLAPEVAAARCGFTADGLPVGLQIAGRRGDDVGVLRLAHAFERARLGAVP
jgi:amidase